MNYNEMGLAEDMLFQQQLMQEQMMQEQMMQEQQMIGQQQVVSQALAIPQIMMDRYGNPKIHKKQALELLRYDLQSVTGCRIIKEIKIEETPNLVRHCCVQCGISQLPKNEYPIPAIGASIPYYFCKGCGTLFIYDDFM